jgi:hypothetical protein
VFQHSYLFTIWKLPHRQCRVGMCIVVMQDTGTHSDINRRHSKRYSHRWTTTQL